MPNNGVKSQMPFMFFAEVTDKLYNSFDLETDILILVYIYAEVKAAVISIAQECDARKAS